MDGEGSLSEQVERVLDQLPEGLLVTDAGGTIRWANAAAAEITGWKTCELEGLSLETLLSPEGIKDIARARGVDGPLALARHHCLLRAKSGEWREVSISVGRANAVSSVYLVRDIGRQIERRLLPQLAENWDGDAFGRMASLVAHDLRKLSNILRLLIANLRRYADDPSFRGDAGRTLETVGRQLDSLTEKLLQPRLPAGLNREQTTLRELVDAVFDLLKGDDRSNVTSTIVSGLDRPLRCDVNVSDMQRVVLNVLLNAYEAVSGGGGQVWVTGSPGPEESQVQLTVEDSGPGISESYLENHLLHPLPSTKPDGLGLGLYQAKLIVEAHGGTIEVANRQNGRGVRVAIVLPAAQDRSAGRGQALKAGAGAAA